MMNRWGKVKYYVLSGEHPWVAFGLFYITVIVGVLLVWGLAR